MLALAREHGTTVVCSPLDSYVTSRMVTLSAPCRALMNAEPLTVRPDDLLSDVAEEVNAMDYRAAIAVDGQRRPIGLITHAELADPEPRRILLVDHAEEAQSAPGVEQAEIVEILDHHHIGSIETKVPVTATFDPVGSTATLVVERFRQNGMEPTPPTATMLLGAVLSDTVILNSPTTTERDNAVVDYLERVLAIDATDFGREMFEATSDVSSVDADDIVRRDAKEYTVAEGRTICIAQIETVGLQILDRRDELQEALERQREAKDYLLCALMVTDILAKNTKMLVAGDPVPLERAFGHELEDGTLDLPGRHEPQEAGRTQGPGRAVSTGAQPSASYSVTIRVQLPHTAGSFAKVAGAIGDTGAILGAIDLVRVEDGRTVRDVTVACADVAHGEAVVAAIEALEGVSVQSVSDRTFLMHRGGKLTVEPKVPITTRDDLSMAYTPGVARVSMAIHDNPASAWTLTIKGNAVAVVTDGTAVLGLGDIGPAAAMPVMEGKAMLFKQFAGVDAFPLCLDTKDADEIVAFVKAVAPGFGGINLEDIAAPRCFEIERRLRAELDIPVFHDDQHGTAIVVLAALVNALRVVGKNAGEIKVVVVGAGAAGVACTEIILAHGVQNLVVCDIEGALYAGRPGLDPERAALAARTNPGDERGMADDILRGADVLVGVSGPGAVSAAAVRTMARDPIVFAMANPVPEIQPEEVRDDVAIMATGRSDYPNQINNVLAFPGVFRGALDIRASTINEEMKLAAARAIAGVIGDDELHADYVIPSVFNRDVAEAVAAGVAEAGTRSGVARRPANPSSPVS